MSFDRGSVKLVVLIEEDDSWNIDPGGRGSTVRSRHAVRVSEMIGVKLLSVVMALRLGVGSEITAPTDPCFISESSHRDMRTVRRRPVCDHAQDKHTRGGRSKGTGEITSDTA